MTKIEVKVPTEKELKELGVKSWDIWTCEVSVFDWEYTEVETCYFLEGNVVVKTKEGETELKPGDLVTFPKGLKCVWEVKKPVRKHFKFG